MATTGFWPIKGDLKGVVDYARNPEKTTMPDELRKTITMRGNSEHDGTLSKWGHFTIQVIPLLFENNSHLILFYVLMIHVPMGKKKCKRVSWML